MAVLLDSKDLAIIDQEFAAESVVWQPLMGGAKSVTEADFVGANEVRVNKMSGFIEAEYVRNGDNARTKIDVSKETKKLEYERWMGYDLDTLDQSENGSYDVTAVHREHVRLVSIPNKDRIAVHRLVSNSGKIVEEAITPANALAAFDAAEEYMTDAEVAGPFVMFASSAYYKALKNAEGVTKSFSTNVMQINGIDRRVGSLDNDIPIIKVPRARLQKNVDGTDREQEINFILVPLSVAAPIEKYNTVDLVPASTDRDGYRDTIKGLDYLDVIVFDNAKKAIYVSRKPITTP